MKTVLWEGRSFDVHDGWLHVASLNFRADCDSHAYPATSLVYFRGSGTWELYCGGAWHGLGELQAIVLLREPPAVAVEFARRKKEQYEDG